MAAPFLCKTEKYMANNEKNLIPNSERTPQQLKEMTSKAGKASGEARRGKKLFSECRPCSFWGRAVLVSALLSHFFMLRYTIRTEMSAGETPEMRSA